MLAGILKNFYESFDMSTFKNRLKLQKLIYLIQANGINLGFGYNFYLYGPYSTDLARAGFQIDNYSEIKAILPEDKDVNHKFISIKDELGDKKEDTTWLECATSIIYLRRLGLERDEIIKTVEHKLTVFSEGYIEDVWNNLKKIGWINE